MQNLIEKISNRTGLNEEKSKEALLIISEHVKQQFPLIHSVVDLVLGTQNFPLEREKSAITDFLERQSVYN
jgi:hypothetical protein